MGVCSLTDVDLAVRAHEIVGIAGVAGNGQSAFADVLSGLRPDFEGNVELLGQSIRGVAPRRPRGAWCRAHSRGSACERRGRRDGGLGKPDRAKTLRSPAISRAGFIGSKGSPWPRRTAYRRVRHSLQGRGRQRHGFFRVAICKSSSWHVPFRRNPPSSSPTSRCAAWTRAPSPMSRGSCCRPASVVPPSF